MVTVNCFCVPDPMSLWSEEESSNFETGLRFYGKDFYLIHQNKVSCHTVLEEKYREQVTEYPTPM